MNLGDGWCDDFNNVAECYFDAGDCCFNFNPHLAFNYFSELLFNHFEIPASIMH